MAYPCRLILKLLIPTRFSATIFFNVAAILLVCAFLVLMQKISRLEATCNTCIAQQNESEIYIPERTNQQTDRMPTENDPQRPIPSKSIAWFNPPSWLHRTSSENMFGRCRHGKKCTISYEGTELHTADAVLVNGAQLSYFPPAHRQSNQIYVFFILEPPTYVNISADWRYAFNWTLSYRRNSDIWKPYGELKPKSSKLSREYYRNVLKKKKKAVAWFVSRCKSQSKREQYVKQLRKYVPVDIYGRCGPYKCGQNCYLALESYRYFLAFENSFCGDYVTEKFFKTFKYDVIPVVRGGADYSSLYGDGVLINTADFRSVKDLGKYLNNLMKNDEEYVRILRNKHHKNVVFPQPWCDLCEMLHNADRYPKTYDIYAWLDQGKCREPNDLPLTL